MPVKLSTESNLRLFHLPTSDTLTRFLLERAGVRGAIVELDVTWQAIFQRADYPQAVADLLGEVCAAAALFTTNAKVEGRLSIQVKAQHAVRTLFAECTSAGTMRGLAHVAGPLPSVLTPRSLGRDAIVAITIETRLPSAREMQRYQGLVGLDADRFELAFEDYFSQSEQLPTRLILTVDQHRACGIFAQLMPDGHGDSDGWNRVNALLDTLSKAELRATGADSLLWKLFHDEAVQVLERRQLQFACSCSRERVQAVFLGLGREEAMLSIQDNGEAEVHCEFCGQCYVFVEAELKHLFEMAGEISPPSGSIQ